MKKVSLLMLVAMLFIGNVRAQDVQVLIDDNFEAYTVGNKIAAEAEAAGNEWWTTWSDLPGSSEDGVIADLDGNKCGYLVYGTDQVILLGDEQSGVYDLEFDILVREGKNAYFNVLHHFDPYGECEWAMQSYFHLTNDGQTSTSAPGRGTIHAGSNNTAEIVCYYDQWMHFRLHINTDTDVAEYYYTAPGEDEVMVCSWQWSLDSFGESTVGRKLAAMDFFPPEDAATSEYYIDNFKLTKKGGETAADLAFNPSEINEKVGKNEMMTVTINVENTGTSIADYTAYVDYGMGEESDDISMLSYISEAATEPGGVAWNLTEPLTFEIAAFFPASNYANTAMGTYLTDVVYQFYEFGEYNENQEFIPGPGLEEGTDVIFRVYGQGNNNVPGEILAEKVLSQDEIVWNDYTMVTFDEPVALRGKDVYVAIEMTQAVDGTVMNTDSSPALAGFGDLFRQSLGGAYQSLKEFTSQDFGNWLITAVCMGTPVTAGYATLTKTSGSLAIGASDEIGVNLNSYGLKEGTYETVIVFNTNVPGNEVVEIPVTLTVDGTSVSEMNENAYSIYPNPTAAQVTIDAENISYVAVYSSTGQLLNVVMNNNVVDMSAYENGVYFFNIVDNAGQKSIQRIVVAK